jgi:hypothetical protein
MKAMIKVAREQFNWRVPSNDVLQNLVKLLPGPVPGMSLGTLVPSTLVSKTPLICKSLMSFLTGPAHDALLNAPISNVLMLLLQTLGMSVQVPKLIDEVEGGVRDFTLAGVPLPLHPDTAIREQHRTQL